MGYFADAGTLVVSTLFGLALFVFVLRVFLQAIRANFYNPICQAIYKITNPPLIPLQKLLPPWKGINLAALGLAWVVSCLWILALLWMAGVAGSVPAVLVLGFAQLLEFVLQTLFWIAMISVLLSWFSPDAGNPAVPLLYGIADIVLKPFRKIIPPLGGFDLSPIFALLALRVAMILLVQPLQQFGMSLR
jgi:YggT family protein